MITEDGWRHVAWVFIAPSTLKPSPHLLLMQDQLQFQTQARQLKIHGALPLYSYIWMHSSNQIKCNELQWGGIVCPFSFCNEKNESFSLSVADITSFSLSVSETLACFRTEVVTPLRDAQERKLMLSFPKWDFNDNKRRRPRRLHFWMCTYSTGSVGIHYSCASKWIFQ